MMSKIFGAPLGGTTRGAHQGLEESASCLITPPNFGLGGGSCLLLMVEVALGEPSTPVTCSAAEACMADNIVTAEVNISRQNNFNLNSAV